jgi:ABC-type transport system substrate-binding protein
MAITLARLLVALGLAALFALAAEAQSDGGKTLRLVPHADLTVVDPQFNFGYLVYDTLFGTDRDFRPQSEMVDTWQVSDDKLTYTFRLRDGGILSGPRDWDRARRLVTEAGYKGERVVLLDPADISQPHAEALVTEQLLKRLGLNVELATGEWGTIVKGEWLRNRSTRAAGACSVLLLPPLTC